MKLKIFFKRKYIKSLLYRIILLSFFVIISSYITYIVAGPQYINPYLSNYIVEGGYLYRNGTVDIGPIYGNIETVLSIATEGFSEVQYISFDREKWKEIKKFPDFTVLGIVNVEKGSIVKFYLRTKQSSVNDMGYYTFRVSAFGIWESPLRLILFITIFSFLIKIYQFLFSKSNKNKLLGKIKQIIESLIKTFFVQLKNIIKKLK